MFTVEGRTAAITGGAHGIGFAYAEALVKGGARVVIADIDGEAAEKAAERLCDGRKDAAVGCRVDVSDEDSVRSLAAESAWPVDILINNAAIFSQIPVNRGSFDALSVEEFDRTFAVNTRGTWLTCKHLAPSMVERGYGKIINVASGTAFKGTASMAHYVASKAAVIALTKSIARTVGAGNVTVNCIAPGSTLSETEPTEEVRNLREGAAKDRAIPRLQRPNDLIGAMMFLASDASDFVTGQTLVVDGGSFMH